MAKENKPDRKAKLAALREKLETTNYGGGGSAGFWSPSEGRNTIRILPEVGNMEFFYQPVGKHWMPDKDNTQVYCPKFTSEGELPCPICELQSELWQAGDKASRSLADKLRVKKAFWMNVMVRDGKGNNSGPFIFTPGITIFEAITALVTDPDYGDIFDEYEGLDLIVSKSGSGLDTKYEVLPKRKASMLMPTEEEIDEVFDESKDLSFVEVSMDPEEDAELSAGHAVFVLPYDRIVEELKLDDGVSFDSSSEDVDEEDDDYDDEEEEEPAEAVQEVRRRRARRQR